MSRALDAYNHIDSDVCLKMAFCTLGKNQAKKRLDRSFENSQAAIAFRIVDHILE